MLRVEYVLKCASSKQNNSVSNFFCVRACVCVCVCKKPDNKMVVSWTKT